MGEEGGRREWGRRPGNATARDRTPRPHPSPAPSLSLSLFTVGLAPCDLLLLMASAENDAPKVAELLRAGADTGVKVRRGQRERGEVFSPPAVPSFPILVLTLTPLSSFAAFPYKDIDGKTPAELATSAVVLGMLADRQKAFSY